VLQQIAEVIKERLRRVPRASSVDDDDVETGAVEERGNDLERRKDEQLDGPCVQRRLVGQADAAVICRRCRAAFARPCALHVLEAGWSARDQLRARRVVMPRLDQGGEAELHVANLLQDRS